MTISYVATGAGGTNSSGPFTVAAPTGAADGDLLVAVGTNDRASPTAPSPPSGWTLRAVYEAASPAVCIYTRAASGEASSYSWTNNNGSPSNVAISAFRGSAKTPQVDAVGAFGHSSTGAVTGPSVTATRSGVLLFIGASAVSPTGAVWTPPSGMTEAYDLNLSNKDSSTIAYVGLTGGTSGDKAATTTSAAWTAILMQIYEDIPNANPLFFGGPF